MRIILLILLVFCFNANAQVGNKNLFLTSANTAPRPDVFDWDNLTPQSPTAYNSAGTLVIENKSFTNLNTAVNNGNDVYVSGSTNITFRNCYFGPSVRKGISIENATGIIKIENCFFASNEGGIELVTSSCTIQIENTQCVNPWGAPRCKGQFIQMANSTMTNSYIRGCRMKQFRGLASTEDWISFFNAGGTSSSRFIVEDNLVQGGGPSITGGGFMLGDHGGAYVTVQNNKFLDPGNYQIAASGGNNFIVQNNLAYSTNTGFSRIGMYAYGQAGAICSNITWQNNGTFIYNGNHWYAGDGSPAESCGTIIGANPTFTQTNITNISFAQLAFPEGEIIDFVSRRVLYVEIIEAGMQFRNESGGCIDENMPVLNTIPIPTPSAGSNQTISGTSTTLNASASTSSNGLNFSWEQTDGPVVATIASPLTAITSVSGLSVPGVYEFMIIVEDNDGAFRAKTMTVTKN